MAVIEGTALEGSCEFFFADCFGGFLRGLGLAFHEAFDRACDLFRGRIINRFQDRAAGRGDVGQSQANDRLFIQEVKKPFLFSILNDYLTIITFASVLCPTI